MGVVAVAVEEVHIVELHAAQALVETGKERLPRTPVAVGAGPHLVARLRGDEEFIAVGREVLLHETAERLLGAARRRPVVVGQIEVGHAVVEGKAGQGTCGAEVGIVPEIVPEAQTHLREQDAAAAAAHKARSLSVAVGMGGVSFHKMRGG